MSEIVLDKVTKRFPDGTEAVHEANFVIGDGEFFILVGPSGCGKSTLLNMIVGLEDISSGDLTVDGKRVNDVDPKDRNMAMVFQSYAIYPHMTVRENMAFPLKLAGQSKEEIERRVDQAAEILELNELLDRKPANLSGGQRQRVAMGRAIVREPAAFLMDEPLSNLDAKLRVQMRTAIAKLQQRLGTTTIYVTHDQTEAMTLGDRVAVMRRGYVQQVGHPARALQLAGQPVRGRLHRLTGHEPVARRARRRHAQVADGVVPVARRGPRADARSASATAGRRHPARAPRGRVAGRRPTRPGRGVHRQHRDHRVDGCRALRALHRGRRHRPASWPTWPLTSGKPSSARSDGAQVTARLDASSEAAEGKELELWLDTHGSTCSMRRAGQNVQHDELRQQRSRPR